ncbi:unnamed protein product [Nesidiocoris tenuis]|uniref:Uncharacterized protein n=1 Tax=Nesidiocoris tenuis TaxID=355587 RepID=A0A6H5H246_9HEMI|nr:unnamed protein product [Nesidiocoris tenuis]
MTPLFEKRVKQVPHLKVEEVRKPAGINAGSNLGDNRTISYVLYTCLGSYADMQMVECRVHLISSQDVYHWRMIPLAVNNSATDSRRKNDGVKTVAHTCLMDFVFESDCTGSASCEGQDF